MRLYPEIDVDITFQNFGSSWLCVLRGSSENIDLVFNGLYNWGATNGGYQFFDHAKTVAVYWSDRRAMRRFFFNRFFNPRAETLTKQSRRTQGQLIRRAMRFALGRIQAIRDGCHESFIDFTNHFEPITHAMGQVRAERPDGDFKDAVMSHAFADKN